MRKRRAAPVTEHHVPASAEARRERTKLMSELHKLEWEFDRHPTIQLTMQLSYLRRQINLAETEIAGAQEESEVQGLVARMERIKAYADAEQDS